MEATNPKEYITTFLWILELYFFCNMAQFFIWRKRTIFTFLLFQHILEIDHGHEYSIVLHCWVRDNWVWCSLSRGDLSLYRAKIHSLYCLANSFFFHDKSISSPDENVSGILPLPLNLPIFISFWQERILSSDSWFCDEPVGFLLRASGEFSFSFWFWNSMRIVSWLPPISDVTSVWSKLSIVPSMSVFLLMDKETSILFAPLMLITHFMSPKSILWSSL